MSTAQTAPQPASTSQWLASAGYMRAWRLKQNCGLVLGRRHLGCSHDAGTTGKPNCLAAKHGMAARNYTAISESP